MGILRNQFASHVATCLIQDYLAAPCSSGLRMLLDRPSTSWEVATTSGPVWGTRSILGECLWKYSRKYFPRIFQEDIFQEVF